MLGSLACGAGLVLLPRFSASGFLDSARRHGATEFNAIGAMLEILMRQPPRPDDADTDLRLCYTGPSPAREWQEAFEERFGLRVVCGYAMSESPYGLIWRHGTRPFGTLGSVRQHPTLGDGQRGPGGRRRRARTSAPGETGELLLRNPAVTPGYWEMPERDRQATIVDGWLHTGDLVTVNADGTYTFVARKKEVLRRRGAEPVAGRGRGGDRGASRRARGAPSSAVPSELTEEEVKAFVVAGAGPRARLRRAARVDRRSGCRRSRCRGSGRLVDALPRTPTARVAKHRLPARPPAGRVRRGATGRRSLARSGRTG